MDIPKKIFLSILFISIAVGFILSYKTVWQRHSSVSKESVSEVPSSHISLTSSAFEQDGTIPVTFTCRADNINPPLTIDHIPANAKTLALIVEDPDAPLGPFVHWIVWNISPDTKDILKGSVPPKSQEGTNSFNHARYDGPCPPSQHRYYFTVYALDIPIGLDGKAKKQELERSMKGHILDQAELIGHFGT